MVGLTLVVFFISIVFAQNTTFSQTLDAVVSENQVINGHVIARPGNTWIMAAERIRGGAVPASISCASFEFSAFSVVHVRSERTGFMLPVIYTEQGFSGNITLVLESACGREIQGDFFFYQNSLFVNVTAMQSCEFLSYEWFIISLIGIAGTVVLGKSVFFFFPVLFKPYLFLFLSLSLFLSLALIAFVKLPFQFNWRDAILLLSFDMVWIVVWVIVR